MGSASVLASRGQDPRAAVVRIVRGLEQLHVVLDWVWRRRGGCKE